MDIVKRSSYLWWAMFFLAYLSFGLLYFLRDINYYVAPYAAVGSEWMVSVGIMAFVAFVVTLPLLIYKHPMRGLWIGLAILAAWCIYSIFKLSSSSRGEELGYFIYFLMTAWIPFIGFLLLGEVLPLFLQKRFVIRGVGFVVACALLCIQVFIIISSTFLISYASTLVEQLPQGPDWWAEAREASLREFSKDPYTMHVFPTQLTSSQARACENLGGITSWAMLAWRPIYTQRCPQSPLLPDGQTSMVQPFPFISDIALQKARDECQISKIFKPTLGLTGVCLKDGSKYVTKTIETIDLGRPYHMYQTSSGENCQRPEFNVGGSEIYSFQDMKNRCTP